MRAVIQQSLLKKPVFTKYRLSVGWLLWPALGFLLVAFATPLLLLLASSLSDQAGKFSIQSYVIFFSDPYSLSLIWNTVKTAGLVTLACIVISYPLAFAMVRASSRIQTLMFLSLILPLSVGVIVKAFSWTILLRSDGIVNKVAMGIGLVEEPIRLLFTQTGLVIGAVHIFLPFMALPLFSVVRQIDPRLSEAASTLGSNKFRAFCKVIFPLTLPGAITGVAFVFSMSVAMYVIPALLIGDRYQTLPAAVARNFLFFRDQQTGSTVAVVLMLIAVAVLVASSLLNRSVQAKISK